MGIGMNTGSGLSWAFQNGRSPEVLKEKSLSIASLVNNTKFDWSYPNQRSTFSCSDVRGDEK